MSGHSNTMNNELHRYTVYQLSIREFSDMINDKGWAAASKLRIEVEAHLAVTLQGSAAWKPEYDDYYHRVCDIRAEDLDEVFSIGNVGPEFRINRYSPMHSISVGDLILAPTGKTFMVDANGFTEVEVHKDAA